MPTCPRCPVVWGISATVERFERAMSGIDTHTKRTSVAVDPQLVQDSGLIKDDFVLSFPEETGLFDTVLLREATKDLNRFADEWAAYCGQQPDGQRVHPLMVVQVPNLATAAMLAEAVGTVTKALPSLTLSNFAHVFGEHSAIEIGQGTIPYIAPERVQETEEVRVLFAKDAVSTGWDCPRAEVLMSYRPADDPTHIAQLLGRMIRNPLARRITGNEVLNSVTCFLPHFDRTTAEGVASIILGGDPDVGTGAGRVLYQRPVTHLPNTAIEERVWEAFSTVRCQTLPRHGAKPMVRLTALAQALATDELLPDAGKTAHAEMHKVLDGLRARYNDEIALALQDVSTFSGARVRANTASAPGDVDVSTFTAAADDRSVEADFRAAGRVLHAALAKTYVKVLSQDDDDGDAAILEAQRLVAAMSRVPQVQEELNREARKLATAG